MSTAVAIQPAKRIIEKKEPRQYTLLEYLKREEISVYKHEFFNGQIVLKAGGKYKHNKISLQIGAELVNVTKGLDRSFDVCGSDMKIYIAEQNHSVYPDAVVMDKIHYALAILLYLFRYSIGGFVAWQ